MNHNTPITICIPNYNGGRFMAPTIQSILSQTFTDFKVIFVDNCSTDDSLAIIKQFKDPRIQVHVNPQHLPVTKNFNRCFQLGMELSDSPYICMMHTDDVYAPRYLEVMKDHLDRFPEASMAHCDFLTIDDNGTPFRDFKFELKSGIINPDGHPYVLLSPQKEIEKLLRANYIICPSTLYRSSLFKDVGFFDETYFQVEDWDLYLRALLKGHKLLYVGQKLYSYRIHGATYSSSNMKNLTKYKEYLNLLQSVAPRISEVYPGVRFGQKQINRITRNILLWDVKNDLLNNDFASARTKIDFMSEKINGAANIPILFLMKCLIRLGSKGGYLLDRFAKSYLQCRKIFT